jgi:four helix bundle protein
MGIKDYKELRIWQLGIELVRKVYLAMKNMPKEEMFSLTNQIKRAAVSIPSNIAEGQAKGTKEFLHYLRIVQGSLAELETQLILTVNLQMLDKPEIDRLLEEIISLKKQTHALMSKLGN